ncbi:MAG: glycoside hydrolase family 25 protein, partial [Ruminococcus sp.]|nr:glycoside hydrolase family 25 protein [Ruminococcus sp.]
MSKLKRLAVILVGACGVCAGLLFLVYKQWLSVTPLLAAGYEVKGVDVTHYQGDIDWETLSDGIDFAYIKATEGSGSVDESFAYNYREARAAGLRVGAFHFFSFDSSGKTQAENFISNVEGFDGMLPPVIDVEYYGDYFSDPKPAEEVLPELTAMIDALRAHYGTEPVIYATGSAYRRYIKDADLGCPLWRRNVYLKPADDWTFWQYSSVGRLDGYNGEEKYIDLNVFNGTREEFDSFGRTQLP